MKLCVVVTHPIQYQVPLFRMLNAEPNIEVEALFLSDHSVKGGIDPGFGVGVKWDVPMLEGYAYRFLENKGKGIMGSGFCAYRFSGFLKIFREIKPDAILVPGHGVMAYWQAVFAAHRLEIPVLVRPESLDGTQLQRSLWKKILRRILLQRFYNRVTVFCATGHFSRLDAKQFGFPKNRIVDVPYCIDTELFKESLREYQSRREEIRQELGLGSEDMGIVYMGKMINWKNPSLILEAIETLEPNKRKRIFPILVGSGPDLEKVRARCREVVGDGRFCCPGFVNQSKLCRYYVAGDVFVLPSKRGHESWGLVVNEAMTCGLSVLVSDGVGCRIDLVENGVTGYVFPDGDVAALRRHLWRYWIKRIIARKWPGRHRSESWAILLLRLCRVFYKLYM